MRSTVVCVATLCATACGNDRDAVRPPAAVFTVSGSIRNNTGSPIPSSARVVAVWSVVSGSPDYSHVYGEGTVDVAQGRFALTFPRAVPREARNSSGSAVGLGVAAIVLTTDPALREGRVPDGYDPGATMVGAAGQFGVIHLDREPGSALFGWAQQLRRGFNVGRGVDLPGSFDEFEPVSSSSVELTVDDLANISFVNWT